MQRISSAWLGLRAAASEYIATGLELIKLGFDWLEDQMRYPQ